MKARLLVVLTIAFVFLTNHNANSKSNELLSYVELDSLVTMQKRVEKETGIAIRSVSQAKQDFGMNVQNALFSIPSFMAQIPNIAKEQTHYFELSKYVDREIKKAKKNGTKFTINIQITPHDGKFDGNYAYCLPYYEESKSDLIVIHEFMAYASPDILTIVLMHQIDYILTLRRYIVTNKISGQEYIKRVEKDPTIRLKIEEETWSRYIDFFEFALKSGLYDKNKRSRPVVDLVIINRFLDARQAKKDPKTWQNFETVKKSVSN